MAKLTDVTEECLVHRLYKKARESRILRLALGVQLVVLKSVRDCVDRRLEKLQTEEADDRTEHDTSRSA